MREGCEVHTGDLRALDEAREATRGCSARHPPGGDRRRDRQLPQAAPHADRGQQRALQRRRARRARPRRRALHLRARARWSSSARPSSRRPRSTSADTPIPRSAYGFSKLTGEVYVRAAHDEHGLPYTICRPVQRLRAGRDARGRAGHRAHGPRPHPQVPEPAARRAAAHLRRRRRRRARSRTSTTSPTGSSPRRRSPAGLNEDFNISAPTSARWPSWRRSSGRPAGATPTSSSSSTCRASRSTSCAAGPPSRRRERLLGWEARIGVHDGIAQTVAWLREAMPQTA